ncbi:hypothetical protein [Haladaptatus salinisoli]|uniref:hypothetical protein n=1 Tax=Haladaptatus salinisoli TaxID=2884876 RepID=UPI001D0B6F5C|nr:hypothetical protein [Haladaptatus salinisoli]
MNDETTNETIVNRRVALVLPILGICWLAFLAYSELGDGANVDLVAMTLGAGLMIAGVAQFLRAPDEADE